jgi:hypothetical protein
LDSLLAEKRERKGRKWGHEKRKLKRMGRAKLPKKEESFEEKKCGNVACFQRPFYITFSWDRAIVGI